MGIQNLGNLIKKHAPNGIQDIKIKDLEDKVIAIDTSIVLYQFLVAIKSNTQELKTKDDKITSHIHAIITKALSFIKKKIYPVFVFDGIAPDLKSLTLEQRKVIKEAAQKKLDTEDISEEEKIKLMKKIVRLTKEHILECKEVLELMGLPVIEAPVEADPQCAYLVKNNIADAVISEDMDLLTFGCDKLIRGVTQKTMKLYDLTKILEELELSQDEFIDMCILLGCDYSDTIGGIGMKRAYDLIKKYGSIDELIENESKIKKGVYKISKQFMYKEAKKYFLYPPIKIVKKKDIKWQKPDIDGLKKLLIDKYDYQLKTVDSIIDNLNSGYYSVICKRQTKEEFLKKKDKYNEEPMFV